MQTEDEIPYPVDERGWAETPNAARHVLTTAGNLAAMRLKGDGPRYKKLGAKVVYSFAELDRWMLSQPTHAHTSGARRGIGGPRKLATGAVR